MNYPDLLLCGYERGGTTLLSEIFRANGYESGFECGVLLAESPAAFRQVKPYWDMLTGGWGISPEARDAATQRDFRGFYETICETGFPGHSGPFFDKTPKYMEQLGRVRARAPFIRGAVVIHRDPRAVFVSMAKRLSPNLPIVDAVEKNFLQLTQRYLSYFIGSIAHLESPDTLFVPFEELVSREDAWLKVLGHFVQGAPFQRRTTAPRFGNVSAKDMDLGKVVEFSELLGTTLQDRILDATRLAALFFADPVERVHYGELWDTINRRIGTILHNFELPRTGMVVDGEAFEPYSYLLRYPDLREAGVNPVLHYQRSGRREKRRAI